jgi:epidermal growth factor receptor substrate 15
MSASEDIHSVGNAGMTNFWSDRNSCEISGQQLPLPPNYHDMTSNKPTGQVRSHLPSQQQKGGGTVHERERTDKLHQNMIQRYQKVSEVAHTYSEMSIRQKGPEEMAVPQIYHELLPRRSQQHEPLVECGMQYRRDVQRHHTQVVKSHVEIQSNKDDRGHHEPPNTITSELCRQDISRSHISSNGINPGPALPNFTPTSVEMHTDQTQQDISRKYPVPNFAAYPPHDAKVSSSDYSAVLGIAQPPSRFSSNVTYTQSKISRSNNYMRLFPESCLEDSYSPQSGDMVSNGFVSNSNTVTVNTVATSGPSHQQIPYHNKEIPNTGMNRSVQIQSPSRSLPSDSIVQYGNGKDSSETPSVITTSCSAATSQISPHLQSCGRMSSDNIPSYHSGSATMQVVESDPLCSLGNSAGLSINPKIPNSSSYISSSPHRRESVVSGTQHVPYQSMLAGSGSENMPACNMFSGNNSSISHSGLFDDFSKKYSSAHVIGTEAGMVSQSSKENCQIIPLNIYSQSNMSPSVGGVEQQLLPLMEDTGSSRPIKKRKPRTKGMAKPDQVQLLGKRWHQGRSSRQVALGPVLDVRQFLATWDEETDDLSPAPRLPDVVLSNSSTENPLLVLDCRNLSTNGVATLSTVDRNSLSDGSPTENLIHMYQQQLASPSESGSASNDTVKSNSQMLQDNSGGVVAQPMGECPSLIPIDPDRVEKFGPPNKCIKSSPEHRTFEHNKPSFFQRQERSTPNDGSKISVSKSDVVDDLVEASTVCVIDKVHSGLDNVSTNSVVSNSIPLHECHTLAESLPSKMNPLPEDCGSFHEIYEKSSGIDLQNSSVVQDECRTSDDSCQNVQGKSKSKSKNCDCLSSDQKMPLSSSEIQHVGPIKSLERKHTDYHQRRKSKTKEFPCLISTNKTAVHTLKALCRIVIERGTRIRQIFEKQVCSQEKMSVGSLSEEKSKVLGPELCGSFSDKEAENTFAENSSTVLQSKNVTDISCNSENNTTKDLTACVSESSGLPYLSDETNDVSDPNIPLKKRPSINNGALYEQTENTSRTEKDMKLSFTCDVLEKEKHLKQTIAHATEISDSEHTDLTESVNAKKTVGIPALMLFDKELPSSRFNLKAVNEDALLSADTVPTQLPASPTMSIEELSNTNLPQSSVEEGITGNEPVMTNEENKLSEQGVKSSSTEPLEPSENKKGLHSVSVSVTSKSETNQLNLFSYSSDIGEDLDMSVTSSTPATPVTVEEVNEESGDEELDMMYHDSVLSDLEGDIRLQCHDSISFSSLPCTSKESTCEDDHSYHSVGMFESLDKSDGLPGTAGGRCLEEENVNPEILSDKDEVVGMCAMKMSDTTCNGKCVLVSCNQTKTLGNNTELSSCSESSLDIPDSGVEDAQIQSIKSPPCQSLEVNHESDLLCNGIQDVSNISDVVPSHTVVLDMTESDSKSTESDKKMQLECKGKTVTEFIPVVSNPALDAFDSVPNEDAVTNILADQFSSHNGTKVDHVLISKPDECKRDSISNSLFCDAPAITADSNHQNEDDNSIDETSLRTPSGTRTVVREVLDLKLAVNKMKNISLDVSVKNVSAASVSSFNEDHNLLVSEKVKKVKRQREDCLLLNGNTVITSASFLDNNAVSPGRSELAVSGDLEDTVRVIDDFKDPEVSVCGHTEVLLNYGSKQLEIEEGDDEVHEVFPLLEGSERLKLSRNYGTVNRSILKTTVSCPENVTSFVKVLETSPICREAVEVTQPLQHDTNVKEMSDSEAVHGRNPKSSVHPECSGNPSSSDMTIINGNVSHTHENSIGCVPRKEDDSSLYVELKSAADHICNRSVVSESQTVPKNISLHQQKFSDSNGEDKLPIAVAGYENELNCRMNPHKSNNIEQAENSDSLLVAGVKSTTVEDNILIPNSQRVAELKSSTVHYQTSDELESETVAHGCQVIDCELESTVTKTSFQDRIVADCEKCPLDPINLSKNTSSKRQEDSTLKEKFVTGSTDSPYDTEPQNMDYLQKNCTKISRNEQKIITVRIVTENVYREDDAIVDSREDTFCKEQNVVSSVTAASAFDTVDDDYVTTTAATFNSDEDDDGDEHDAVLINVAAAIATDEHCDGIDKVTAHSADGVASTPVTTSADGGSDCDNSDIADGCIAVSTATFTGATSADETANMDAYTSVKDQSNIMCQNLVRCVSDADTSTTSNVATAATTTTVNVTDTSDTTTIVSDADTSTATSTVTTATTTTTVNVATYAGTTTATSTVATAATTNTTVNVAATYADATTTTTTESDADTTTVTTGDADTTTATTTVCVTDTVADTTTTITSSSIISATDINTGDADGSNTAVEDEADVITASVIIFTAVTTTTTTATTTVSISATATTTTPASATTTTAAATITTDTVTNTAAATSIAPTSSTATTAATTFATVTDTTTTSAAVTTVTAAAAITSGDCNDNRGGGVGNKGNGITELLVSHAVEEDWRQHDMDIQCICNCQMASRSNKAEQKNDMDMEQTHITSMVTSGSVTLEEEETVKLPLGTTRTQECYQVEGKLDDTWNLEVEQNCESTECNHNESLKSTTLCKAPTSPADLSHDSYHTECDNRGKLPCDPETVESKSQQQDEPNQEEITHCEMDTVAYHMKPLQLQCQSTVEPAKAELNNYVHKLPDESCALSVREECLSLDKVQKNNISDCVLDMPHNVPVQQEHHCLEESIKDEIYNSEVKLPADMPIQLELKSANRIIKDEINCEISIASDSTSILHVYHSPLELDKEEMGDFKINMPENVAYHLSTEQDSSEDLDEARIAHCVSHMSSESSLKEECLSLQETTNSEPNSPIGENSGLAHINTPVLTSTKRTMEVLQSSISTQDAPDRQDTDLSVDTDDMPHLEAIAREVSPNSSDSLEMPCLELITDPVQPTGRDQVLQGHDSPTLEATVSSQRYVHESEGNKDTEMSVHSHGQVINSADSEPAEKQVSSVSTTSNNSLRSEEENFSEDYMIQEEPPAGHILSVCHNSVMLQDDQKRYLSTEREVIEEYDGSLVKAVECEIQEVSVAPETQQVLSGYIDSGTASVKVVEINPEYMQVVQTDVSGGWQSLHMVTSDTTCSPSCEKMQNDAADISTGEEVLASHDVGKAQLPSNLENETSILSLNESGTENSLNLEAGTTYLTGKENEALISKHSENVSLATAALPDTSNEPSSVVYSEILPGLDPDLGDIMPVDSVSNWPYLEEEVFSEFPAEEMDSSSSVSVGPCLTPVQSTPSSNSGDTIESETSLSCDSNSQYNFRKQSGSDDVPVAINGLKCRLSWKKIFALSKADKKKKKNQETKTGENAKVTREDSKCCANSGQQLKEYSEISHGVKLLSKCERLNGNLKRQIDLKDKGIGGLELGPAKIEVRLPPTSSQRGHPKAWRVVDAPKAETVLNQGESNRVVLSASAGSSSCRSVIRDVRPLTSGMTQMPVVLVKRLILKRRCDDDSDADSDTKRKKLDQNKSSHPIARSADNDSCTHVAALSEQTEGPHESACDTVSPHGKRLEDSQHINGLQQKCDSSNFPLMTSSSSSQQMETQADETTDGNNSESEDESSHTSIESNRGEAEFCKSNSSSSLVPSEENDDPPANTHKRQYNSIGDSKPPDIDVNLNISFNEPSSTNNSVSSEDNTKHQLPRVIIKRTVGMGNTNKYQSFLRSVSSCSESSNRWQPVVRLERSLSLDKLAKNSTLNNLTFEATKMSDSLQHGLKISLNSSPGHPHVTLVPLPSLACSSVDKHKRHSEGPKKRRYRTLFSRADTQHDDLNDRNPQGCVKKLTSLKSSTSFCVRRDPCLTSLSADARQLPSPKSRLSQRSPPIKLKFFSNCNRVKNGKLKMYRNKTVTGNCGYGGDEYVVVGNRNYTKDNMTKITFQRHKRKEVSARKEYKEGEMKVNKFTSDLDVPAVPNQNVHADVLAGQGVQIVCSEDSSNTSDLTLSPQGSVKRRLSIERDQETSKAELNHSQKKHMSNVNHVIASLEEDIATALEDTGDMVSEDCSQSDAVQPETVWTGTGSNDYCPKIFSSKKRQYFDDMYLEKDALPLFQPDRILSISSTKKKQSSLKKKSPQLDGKTLEEEIISLSADAHMDYNEIFSKQVVEDTVVKPKEGQKFSTEGDFGTYPSAEDCPEERVSSKDDGLVSSSKELEPDLHTLSDCETECVGSSSMLKACEEQKLLNGIQPSVAESSRQGDDACQACGHIYSSYDERTSHIRQHPYHCQRCHLAFRSEVSVIHILVVC